MIKTFQNLDPEPTEVPLSLFNYTECNLAMDFSTTNEFVTRLVSENYRYTQGQRLLKNYREIAQWFQYRMTNKCFNTAPIQCNVIDAILFSRDTKTKMSELADMAENIQTSHFSGCKRPSKLANKLEGFRSKVNRFNPLS